MDVQQQSSMVLLKDLFAVPVQHIVVALVYRFCIGVLVRDPRRTIRIEVLAVHLADDQVGSFAYSLFHGIGQGDGQFRSPSVASGEETRRSRCHPGTLPWFDALDLEGTTVRSRKNHRQLSCLDHHQFLEVAAGDDLSRR